MTVTLQVAFTPLPSAAMAVMVHEPADLAVTMPLVLTIAILVLLLDHVNSLFVASLGVTVAVSDRVPPSSSVTVEGLSVMLVTG